MDLQQLMSLGVSTQLSWVDHPTFTRGGGLQQPYKGAEQFGRTNGWASQIVGAPGYRTLPASQLGGAIGDYGPDVVSRYERRGRSRPRRFKPYDKKKKKKPKR